MSQLDDAPMNGSFRRRTGSRARYRAVGSCPTIPRGDQL